MDRISARKLTPRHYRRIARAAAADALWAAFPGRSENDVAKTAASVLGTSPDTIRRILRHETDARWSLLFPIVALGLAARGLDLADLASKGDR